ncbi:hypothetical protein Tco_0951135 [Tanacetum coccineum]|uniref:Uncharacterized protein n=1 Tax=Tanacetum coccineum TaxID=301880 RepID=A0ABQ5DT97_9ASTR
MATMAENVIVIGFETRPPMLKKCMYDSWKTQIILYIRGKENSDMLKDLIDNNPYQLKPENTVKDTYGVTDIHRPQRVEDLVGQEKSRYDSDIKAVNILLLGFRVDSLKVMRAMLEKNQASGARVVNSVGNVGANQPRQLLAEQLYWSSSPSPPGNVSKPTKVFPKKLPLTSQVLKNLNNARDLLSKFDECIKRRTMLSPHQIESWVQSDIKGAFKKDVIPFFENLKETFKLFEKGFMAEVKEMKDIFEQMEDEELLEEARALKPLNEHIGHASKFAERIQELLVYVSASCLFTQSGNEKWAPVTCHRRKNKPYLDASKTTQTITTITQKHAVKQNTQKTDNTMLPSTRRVSSTNASTSKPRSNIKNDRIPQPSSRSKKNKVETHHRKFKSSTNKKNHISDCNANIKNVALSKNYDIICLSCNEFKSERKPTGQIFKTIGLKWIPTGRTINLVGKPCPPSKDTSAIVVPTGHILTTTVISVDEPCLKLCLRYANARESLSKCMLDTESHPFNLHDFGIERIIWYEELPPWKFNYLGVT